jgi:hypothetical protein
MSSIQNPLANVAFKTKEVPTLYCNHASPAISFHDIRVYLSEVFPKEMAALVLQDKTSSVAPEIEPRLCLVLAPEFAKMLGQALLSSVEKYENVFGPLRPIPNEAAVYEKLRHKE